MKHVEGNTEEQKLAWHLMSHLVLNARGPALSLAKAAMQQYPRLLRGGIPPSVALHETLQNMIFAARVKIQHCVDTERHVFDDFIELCINMDSQISPLT